MSARLYQWRAPEQVYHASAETWPGGSGGQGHVYYLLEPECAEPVRRAGVTWQEAADQIDEIIRRMAMVLPPDVRPQPELPVLLLSPPRTPHHVTVMVGPAFIGHLIARLMLAVFR